MQDYDSDQEEEDDSTLELFTRIERLVADRTDQRSGRKRFLVKWDSLGYDECTWELADDPKFAAVLSETGNLLAKYEAWQEEPAAKDLKTKGRTSVDLDDIEVGVHEDGRQLRSYQLEGVRWLLHCWQKRQGSILADEMGLGKTVQAVSFCESLRQAFNIRGPYLIVAPLSTIPHWYREFSTWTTMNAVVYHGSAQAREVIRKHEFRFGSAAQTKMGKDASKSHHLKFNVLITTYETVLNDASLLAPVQWAGLVVDEAHRLKNSSRCGAVHTLSPRCIVGRLCGPAWLSAVRRRGWPRRLIVRGCAAPFLCSALFIALKKFRHQVRAHFA